MIGVLLAEGERGVESLEILISHIHPDLLADIVVTNMKHLPKSPPPLARLSSLAVTRPSGNLTTPNATSSPLSITPTFNSLQADPKRDSQRDPRRHDPRRVGLPVGTPSEHIVEDTTSLTQGVYDYLFL